MNELNCFCNRQVGFEICRINKEVEVIELTSNKELKVKLRNGYQEFSLKNQYPCFVGNSTKIINSVCQNNKYSVEYTEYCYK